MQAGVLEIKELQKKVIEFRDARDWGQYHNPKDLAISLILAAARYRTKTRWE
jgi:hypothetical protein